MTAYEETEKILFSADAFGRFGSLERTARAPWVPQARRYYYNIIGKYGAQVQALLKKTSALEIQTICRSMVRAYRRAGGVSAAL